MYNFIRYIYSEVGVWFGFVYSDLYSMPNYAMLYVC